MSVDRIPREVVEAAAHAIRDSHPRDVEYSLAHYLPEAEAAIRAALVKLGLRFGVLSPLEVRCPKRFCHARPGETCYKRWGRPTSPHPERVARAAISTRTFNIAFCPRCGLHGHRKSCHTCGGPVEQIPMREVGLPVEEEQ